jgi:hypothetical protein
MKEMSGYRNAAAKRAVFAFDLAIRAALGTLPTVAERIIV